jgi:hypothetical protein
VPPREIAGFQGLPRQKRLTARGNDLSQFLKQIHSVDINMRALEKFAAHRSGSSGAIKPKLGRLR